MDKFFNRFLAGVTAVILLAFSLLLDTREVSAQVTLKIGTKTVRNTERSSPSTRIEAIRGIGAGRATLVLTPSQQRTREIRFQSSNKVISLKGARSSRIMKLSTQTSNPKTLEISTGLIEAIVGLLPDPNQQQTNLEVPKTFATVYRRYSYKLCQSKGEEVAAIDSELFRKGVRSVGSYCAVAENVSTSPECGGLVFAYRMHVIDRSQLINAIMAEFYPLDWLNTKITVTDCNPSVVPTIEMVGTITNRTCETTQNSVEDFDRWLAANGLKVLEATCGFESFFRPPVCGQPDNVYRSVRINSSQRALALQLGLRERGEFSGLVQFGQACPTPVVVDPPLRFVEMVGVISNVVCNPPQNTVAQFDKMLSDAKVTVVSSTCGYSNLPSASPCRDVYRSVTIPESQEVFGVILGLFRRSNLGSTVTFGQSCPL